METKGKGASWQERWRRYGPDLALGLLVLYAGVLGFATLDELLGWGLITPSFK
jgi:hypothetical protein